MYNLQELLYLSHLVNMIEKLIEYAISDFNKYKDLPLAVYVTAITGEIILYNNFTKNLFHLIPKKDAPYFNVNDYYFSQKKRDRVLKEMREVANNNWQTKRSLTFKVNNRKLNVKYFCKIYKEKGELLGSICFVSETTGFEEYKQLEEGLPVGLFEISKKNEVTDSNKKFRDILNIPKSHSGIIDIIKYLSVSDDLNIATDVYEQKKAVYKSIIKELSEEGFIRDKIIPITKHNRENIIAKINLWVQEEAEGRIYKTKGSIEDISFKAILEDIQKLNIGLFMLEQKNGDLIIYHSNEYFKTVFSIPSSKSCIGWNFNKLFNNRDEYKNVYDKIVNTETDTIDLTIRYPKSDETSVEPSLHIKKLIQGGSIRYAGAVYTDSDEVEKTIKETRNNFSSFLHSYSAMANNIKDTLQAIIDAHGTDAVEENGRVNRELTFKRIQNHISGFEKIKNRFLSEINRKSLRPLNNQQIGWHLNNIISRIDYTDISKASAATIRNNFIKIRTIIDSYEDIDKMSKETIKTLRNEIIQVLRFSRLLSLNYIENEAYEMTLEVESFKDILKSKSIISENKVFNLIHPVDKALAFLHEFADRRNITLKKHYHSYFEGLVIGDERNLFTVFYNIIHNAIKYTYIKPDSKTSTVDIKILKDLQEFKIIVENRGVGILQEEIDSGDLFKFGSRGKSSADRNRTGHGVGLWHCQNIINHFKGSINIESEQIGYGKIELNSPYITTVTTILPKAKYNMI